MFKDQNRIENKTGIQFVVDFILPILQMEEQGKDIREREIKCASRLRYGLTFLGIRKSVDGSWGPGPFHLGAICHYLPCTLC